MTNETEIETRYPGTDDAAETDETVQGPEIPVGIVLARIIIVSAMSFSAAVAIFCLVGGIWLVAGLAAVGTVAFLFLMFAVERLAER